LLIAAVAALTIASPAFAADQPVFPSPWGPGALNERKLDEAQRRLEEVNERIQFESLTLHMMAITKDLATQLDALDMQTKQVKETCQTFVELTPRVQDLAITQAAAEYLVAKKATGNSFYAESALNDGVTKIVAIRNTAARCKRLLSSSPEVPAN
ncbi:MAG: hypothetical protein JWL82_198, partial [Parcubacteria group bacterium]|nr:hypothetical protein [Parcubacteria group bacterium]